jgi:hypothetical protein
MSKVGWLIGCTRIGLTVVAFLLTTSTALSQVPRDNRPQAWPDGKPPQPKPGEIENLTLEADRKAMEKNSKRLGNRPTNPATPNETASRELTPAQKRLLSPTLQDMVRFGKSLKAPDTGLFRLLPKGKFEYSPQLVSANDPKQLSTLPVTGGGAAYSFTWRRHELSEWSEIGLQDGKLFSGFAGGVLGFMANLGDVPLEGISLETPGVADLQALGRPTSRSEAIQQSQRNSQGFPAGSFTYYSVLPAVPGSTYVLRSVAEGRGDVLIAFRLCRQDEDGSLIVLWKLLNKASAPFLK